MKVYRRLPSLLLPLIVLCLSGCGGGDGDDSSSNSTPSPPMVTVPPAAAATMTAEASLPPEVGAVVWASSIDPVSGAPVETGESFPVTIETIYAVVEVARLPAGAAVSASWWFNGTSLDTFSQSATLSDGYPSGWLEFHLTRQGKEVWPDGEYEIAISINSTEVQRSQIALTEI